MTHLPLVARARSDHNADEPNQGRKRCNGVTLYIPHTPEDQRAMLERIGVANVDNLFDCIPANLRMRGPLALPPALTEMELTAHMSALANANRAGDQAACFLGGGCYDHFVPAVVDVISSRSEYYTAYTPYQAEASQGTLQVGFEFQTLSCQLTGMEVANASLYEGATAVVEAALMARASGERPHRIAVCESVHPEYRQTLATYVANLGVELIQIPAVQGITDLAALKAALGHDVGCLVLQSPNFFGGIEPVAAMSESARQLGVVVVQAYNPISLGVLRRPGDLGVDIAVAEGQALGTPVSYGGPFLGLFACREKFVRRLPGRVVGQTVDRYGKRCFVLTLQTREQHIRREKATSNICTNQGLLALRASVYLALLGPQGLKETAELCWHKAHYAAEQLARIPGIRLPHGNKFFHEFVIELPHAADQYLPRLLDAGYHAGIPLGRWYPGMERSLLVAVTEKRTRAEIDGLVNTWKKILT